jgi:uncharacterized membrane protein YhaH (DUF805 family)
MLIRNQKDEIVKWCTYALKKYVVFRGRARRKEYWYFTLCVTGIYAIIGILAAIIIPQIDAFGVRSDINHGSIDNGLILFGCIFILFAIMITLPTIAITVRRLHDTNHNGWWVLLPTIVSALVAKTTNPLVLVLSFVPSLWLLFLMCQEGQKGENKYGPDPKESSKEINEQAESFS